MRLLPVGGVEVVLEMAENLLFGGQNIINTMREVVPVLVSSLARLDVLKDMIHGLLNVARHLMLASGFLVQGVEFVGLKQVVERGGRRA